jgi:hypothetical protein
VILYIDIESIPIEVPEGADEETIKKLSLSACTARVREDRRRDVETVRKIYQRIASNEGQQ